MSSVISHLSNSLIGSHVTRKRKKFRYDAARLLIKRLSGRILVVPIYKQISKNDIPGKEEPETTTIIKRFNNKATRRSSQI